ncbi:angiopoietin-related protein 1-like [Physella acuta]|uniref:angiopoietin-related protein 1-like n=1 Tax=Physella acuta TaxID=109671 RepID=UPI0027DB0215|nr:angiopoietin-related protein 1-like [Physella acuta]
MRLMLLCYFIFVSLVNVYGFKMTMDTEMYLEAHKIYCGQLVCVQDTESHVTSIANMSIYSIRERSGKVIIAHLSEQGLQKDKDSPYKAAGQMTQTTAKLTVSVEGTSGCGLGAFLCQLYFVDPHGRADVREVFVFPPPTADESSPDLKFSLQLEVPWSNKPLAFRNKGKSLETSCDKMSKDSSEIMSEVTRFNESEQGQLISRNAEITLDTLQILESNLTQEIEIKFQQLNLNLTNTFSQLGKEIGNLRKDLGTTKHHEIQLEALKNIEGNLTKQIENKFRTIEEIFETKFKTMHDKFDEIIKNLTDKSPQFGAKIGEERTDNLTSSKDNKQDLCDAMEETNLTNALCFRIQSLADKCSKKNNVEAINNTITVEMKCEKGHMSSSLPQRIVLTHSKDQKILCDTYTDGGGWIVMVRRIIGDVNFTRNWEEYKWGFGSFDGDFWLGNELVANITSEGNFELRADMRYKEKSYYAVYDSFKVESEADGYRLRIGNYRGDAGDSLTYHKDKVFSTFDGDPSQSACAIGYKGGWWYYGCHLSHPTGVWKAKAYSGLTWYHVTGWEDSVDEIEMKFRRK